jgi:hypothetical protein
VIAYLSWHRPAADVAAAGYEDALGKFHGSLARRPPSGFRGSTAFRVRGLPWAGETGGEDAGDTAYEDWYLLDDWTSLGVLEEAAVARGHVSRHDALAGMAALSTSAIYRLSEGQPRLPQARVAVWVARAPGQARPLLADLLADGANGERASLWRRSLGLGPAPEYCLLAAEEPAGAAPTRLPRGWHARVCARELVYGG